MYIKIKRAMDVFFSAILLMLGAIPLLIVALIVKLESKGPALFKQEQKNAYLFSRMGESVLYWKKDKSTETGSEKHEIKIDRCRFPHSHTLFLTLIRCSC